MNLMTDEVKKQRIRLCVQCSAIYATASRSPVAICSDACLLVRRAARAKRAVRDCSACGAPVEFSGKAGLAKARSVFASCSVACQSTVTLKLRQKAAASMSATNRRYASARMLARNPMAKAPARAKMRETLRRIGHRPLVQGGNGRGQTVPQSALLAALPSGWVAEHIVQTKMSRGNGFPTHYKLDLANPTAKIAVEVDGLSHRALVRQDQDARKAAFLEERGWTVLRFRNEEVLADTAACAARATEAVG